MNCKSNRPQRVAQLVGERRQELVLAAVGFGECLTGQDVPGDVVEVADDAVLSIGERDAVDLPLVIFAAPCGRAVSSMSS